MVTFEVLVNGKSRYEMDAGDPGSLHMSMIWASGCDELGKRFQHSSVSGFALNQSRQSHHWPDVALKVGDEVTVRIIENEVRDTNIGHPTWWK